MEFSIEFYVKNRDVYFLKLASSNYRHALQHFQNRDSARGCRCLANARYYDGLAMDEKSTCHT